MSGLEFNAVLDRVDELFAQYHAKEHAPGLAYGIIADGQLVHTGGMGSLGTAGKPGPDSIFRIASMTKPFTAAALLLLRDRGQVRLDAPASEYVPELSGWRGPTADSPPVTVRDLATMAAGLPTDNAWADRMESNTEAWLGEFLAAGPGLVTAPGTEFKYSNLGYAILGRIIANVSGRPYRDFVTSELLAPLGLRDTGYDYAKVDAARRAAGHRRAPDGSWEIVPFSGPGAFSPIGGLFSTVADLAVWVSGMIDAFPARDGADNHPLSRASRREMQQLQRVGVVFADLDVDGPVRGRRAVRGAARGYGLGHWVTQQTNRGLVAFHGGGYPGFGTEMRWHPVGRVGVIALANGTYANTSLVCISVLDVLLDHLGAPNRRVRLRSATALARKQAERLVDDFDDAQADAVFAVNVDMDLPRDHRRAALTEVRDRAGTITGSEALWASSPAELEWRRTGADADQLLMISMSPAPNERIQQLTAKTIAHPSAALAGAAEAVVAALGSGSSQWPIESTGPAFSAVAYERLATIAIAVGGPFELDPHPVKAADVEHGTFRITTPGATWRLILELNADLVVRAELSLALETSREPSELRF